MTTPLNPTPITHIFTDLFGTCFDASGTLKTDRQFYADQIGPWRRYEDEWNEKFDGLENQEIIRMAEAGLLVTENKCPTWQPLILPNEWQHLRAFDDALAGIMRLRQKFTVCTLTNFPIWMQVKMCKNSKLVFDGYVDLELAQCYKPFSATYRFAAKQMRVLPEKCLMVTSNAKFGDLEGAVKEGMQSILVDRDNKYDFSEDFIPQSFTMLAEMLEC